jgi:penicillin-binding protein 1A
MRKKNAGALFMDFRVSPDDRVGAQPKRTRGRASKPAKKVPRGARVEPELGAFDDIHVEEERPSRGRPAAKTRGKVKKTRGRRQREPLTLGRIVGKFFYWGVIASVWASIAVVGVFAYYFVQLPSSETWAVPDRPPNIRVLAANGQLLSNRGKTGGEAVSLRELPYYVPAAFVAIEDRRFKEHFGIDVLGLASVALESMRAGEVTRGASTITQQLAKNLFLSPAQTLERKV